MTTRTIKPNFFLVGAPKCGTTSLYEYLRRHPKIFLPHNEKKYWLYKEPFYFCPELIVRDSLRIQNESSYLKLFEKANNGDCIGEASTLYLYSTEAAKRIKKFSSNAKIIIMLRNPVDFIVSLHRDNVKYGHEDIISLPGALAAESARHQGHKWPKGSGYPRCTLYREMANFAPQVKRFLDVFGRDSVRIWLLEDLSKSPKKIYCEILQFLNIDTSFIPEFSIYNKKEMITQSRILNNKLKNWMRQYAGWLRNFRPFIPPLMSQSFNKVVGLFSNPVYLANADEQLKLELRKEMRPRIEELSQLLERNLSIWY